MPDASVLLGNDEEMHNRRSDLRKFGWPRKILQTSRGSFSTAARALRGRALKPFVLTLAVLGLSLFGPRAASAQVELPPRELRQLLFTAINAARLLELAPPVAPHRGLRREALFHSRDLAAIRALNHDGFLDRLQNATPVPYEENGIPDDGFTGWVCENVAWVSPRGNVLAVANALLELWLQSPPHHACLMDRHMNVAGLALAVDGSGNWYATFYAAEDTTRR